MGLGLMSLIMSNDNYSFNDDPADNFVASSGDDTSTESASTTHRQGNANVFLPANEVTAQFRSLLVRTTDFVMFRGKAYVG